MRRYINGSSPQFDTAIAQVAWETSKLVSGNQWELTLKGSFPLPFNVGDLLGVKSKMAGEPIYITGGGTNLQFIDIKWTRASRVLLRGGPSNVLFFGCIIERDAPVNGQIPCLSTAGGGIQLNQPDDPVSQNITVQNCNFDSAGDDLVAFFNVNGGSVHNCLLTNGFARGILITTQAKNICKDAQTRVINCPILGSIDSCP